MPIKTVQELVVHELSDTDHAQKQMTRSLPELARASTDAQLADAFEQHLEGTRGQVERIEPVAEACSIKPKRIKCEAMDGLLEETLSLIAQIEAGAVLDAAWIGAAQKAEHDEIPTYTSLCLLAVKLGFEEAVPLWETSLQGELARQEAGRARPGCAVGGGGAGLVCR